MYHFFRGPILHQEDLHLDTNMRDQLYIETQILIHHNLVQYKISTPFMWLSYHNTITLYDNLVISYLRQRRGAPLFIGLDDSYGFVIYPSFTHFLTKHITVEFSPYLSNHTNI